MTRDRREFLATGVGAAAILAAGSTWAAAPDDLIVQAPVGPIRGRRVNGVNTFTGIPYGRSTAGAGRFRPPQAAARFTEPFDATGPAAVPPQLVSPMFPAPGEMSEDCLHLNIWSPETAGPHPVLVWIYGGGNVSGACGMPIYDGQAFTRERVVVVNINYRVGALGFLELGAILGPDYRTSSNNALRDHLLALTWVQDNIAAFGGDPKLVTIAGESGGAFNVECLLGAPAAKGLFRRAIMASGGESVQDVTSADKFTEIYLRHLGGRERLTSASFQEIVAAQPKAAAEWPFAAPFRQLVNPGGLLPVAPLQAIAAGSAREVDLMIGVTRDETRLLVPLELASQPKPKLQLSELTPEQLVPITAAYGRAFPKLSQAELVWKASTAEAFGISSMRIADAQADAGGRVHRYILDYPIPTGPFGATTPHGLDLPLIFGHLDSGLAKMFGFSAADLPMTKTVREAWASFIHTGTPHLAAAPWPPYDTRTQRTMLLSRTPEVAQNVDALDRKIWAGVG